MSSRLTTLKESDFIDLIGSFQNSDTSLLAKFRKFEISAENNKKKESVLSAANKYLAEFIDYYEAFFHHYNMMRNSLKNPTKQINSADVEEARLFIDACGIHITRISTVYVQPLTNEINLDEAERSIAIGKWSIGIGVIAILISIYLSFFPVVKIPDTNEEIIQQYKHLSDQMIVLQKKVDSLRIVSSKR